MKMFRNVMDKHVHLYQVTEKDFSLLVRQNILIMSHIIYTEYMY